ncbi:MucR family transcriptional regulator [Nguyenibacter vanlangensis]|uniref:MucR family transcriptional regulator n=1 Tax=Nguyenibacter vanlangensis TaxID=1216886 RepID=A0A7Y7IV27_9PROT|nr:MucR family transcriptional regulator [Nguyenibacter vanlangensis]
MSNDDAVFLARLNAMTQIVTAHMATTKIETDRVPEFIQRVYASIPTRQADPSPAVSLREYDTATDKERPARREAAWEPTISAPASARPEGSDAPVPAVPIQASVFPDYIICLEDGRKLKSLKRHLMSAFGMTLAAYRAKWGLPEEYPTVAPNFAARRREVAQAIGLGRRSSIAAPVASVPPEESRVVEATDYGSIGRTARQRPQQDEYSLLRALKVS